MKDKPSKASGSDEALVSVIVPVYNVDPFLRPCLKSIASQTHKNLEIILIDDASTDRSGYICDDFVSRDLRFQVLHKRENGGPAKARNSGLRRAKGKYIAFVDGDDVVEKDFIKKLYTAAEDNNAEIAVCGYVSSGFKHAAPEGVISGRDATVRLLTTQENADIVVWNKIYLAAPLKQIRFAEAKAYEDNLTTYKYYASSRRIVSITNALYHYNVREDSIMGRSSTFEHLSAKLMATREAQKYFRVRDKELYLAAEFSEALAEFCFVDKALQSELPLSEYKKHRARILKLAKKLSRNPYLTVRVKWYIRLIRPLGGFPYKFFRHMIN